MGPPTRLEPALITEPSGSEVFSVRFSPDDAFLAVSSARGPVSVYNRITGKEAYRLTRSESHPVKQVCWRPEREDAPLRTREVLVGASTDGRLRQWHVTSGQCVAEFGEHDGHQLLCLDYSPDGSRVAAGGLQELWVYDEETKKQVAHLAGGDTLTTGGHTNRIFATRFPPEQSEANMLISGGWDNTVQFWDLRAGHSVRALYGPHICGDALDISSDGRTILTGSWRHEDPLELWDFTTGKRLKALPWRGRGLREPVCLLYTARFSRDPHNSLIAAGGSVAGEGAGECKVIRRESEEEASQLTLGTLVHFTCLTADFSGVANQLVALGGSDGRVSVFRLSDGSSLEETSPPPAAAVEEE